MVLPDDLHADMLTITSENLKLLDLPTDSFRRLFWDQQLEAALQNDAHTMRWHPLMIRWCLQLRHRFVLLV